MSIVNSLTQADSIMGSGGLIVMDEHTCMVDVAKYFLKFTSKESCGKCVVCRVGTTKNLEILEKITTGKGETSDLETLEELAHTVRNSSLCGLGQTAPNPVLTTLKYFRDEYLEHIENHRCPAAVCRDLVEYRVIKEKCTGCQRCVSVCPTEAISEKMGKWVGLPDKSTETNCLFCLVGCVMNINSNQDRVINIGPKTGRRTNPPQICVRGKFVTGDIVHHPQRVLKPMIKKGDKWIEVSWKKAINFTADKLKKYTGSKGNS